MNWVDNCGVLPLFEDLVLGGVLCGYKWSIQSLSQTPKRGRIPKINDGKLQNHDTKIGDPITNFEELVPSWCGTGATWQCSSRITSRVLNGDDSIDHHDFPYFSKMLFEFQVRKSDQCPLKKSLPNLSVLDLDTSQLCNCYHASLYNFVFLLKCFESPVVVFSNRLEVETPQEATAG